MLVDERLVMYANPLTTKLIIADWQFSLLHSAIPSLYPRCAPCALQLFSFVFSLLTIMVGCLIICLTRM